MHTPINDIIDSLGGFDHSIYSYDELVSCATTLHLMAWASCYEENGGVFSPGTRIDDVAPPVTRPAIAAAIAVLRAATNIKLNADANDLAHHAVGSGGGNGTDFRKCVGLWTGEFSYYVGDDGFVYAFISPLPQGGGNAVPDHNACVGTEEDMLLPD